MDVLAEPRLLTYKTSASSVVEVFVEELLSDLPAGIEGARPSAPSAIPDRASSEPRPNDRC
jgi:hypothetical protein